MTRSRLRTIRRRLGRLLWQIAVGEDRALAARTRSERRHGSARVNLLVGEEGKITIVTIIVVMIFILLIGLVGNAGQSVIKKIELQNAADSAAYSTAVWQARAMNAITATNHLMGELTALIVVHEAFGGPTLENGGDPSTSESDDMDRTISFSKDSNVVVIGALYTSYLGFAFRDIDQQIIDETEEEFTEDDDTPAGATLYDARLTLKYGAGLCLATKIAANGAGLIGEALEKTVFFSAFGVVLKVLADVTHVSASILMADLYKEWLILEGIEFAAKTFLIPKTLIRDGPLFKLLSGYSDQIALASGGQGLLNSHVGRVAAETLDELRGQAANVSSLSTFPAARDLTLPVEPEKAATANGDAGRVPSLWGENNWSSPLGTLSDLLDPVKDAVDDLNDAIGRFNKLFGGDEKTRPFKGLSIGGLIEPHRVTSVAGEAYAQNQGFGYDENPSLEDLPDDIPWEEEQTSQWVRATYPYVDSFRAPIREWLHDHCGHSNASTYFVNWTNRYTIVESFKLRSAEQADDAEDDDEDNFAKLRDFRKKIEQLRADLEAALEPQGDLDNLTPVTSAVEKVSQGLNDLLNVGLTQEVRQALQALGVPVEEWTQAVRSHKQDVQSHAQSVAPPEELEIEPGGFKQLMSDVTLVSTLDDLLRLLESISETIDQVVDAVAGPPHMYVMAETQTTGKGAETWTTVRERAEERFTVLAFAHRGPAAPPFFGSGRIYANQHPQGTAAVAQAMFYNAGGSRADRQQDDNLQPDTGWDTLNWQTPVKAKEWKAGPSSASASGAWNIFFSSREANENARVKLNWQAKLVPISAARLRAAADSGDVEASAGQTIEWLLEDDRTQLFNN